MGLFIGFAVIHGLFINHDLKEAKTSNLQWRRFSSEVGQFTASFPGTPQEKTDLTSTAAGEIEVHSFIVELQRFTYGICYSDLPENLKLPGAEAVFDGSQDSTVKSVGGRKAEVVAQETMVVAGFPAREFEFKAGGKANFSVRARMVLVGKRIYTLTTVFLTANPDPENRKKFFDSFSVREDQRVAPPKTDPSTPELNHA